MGSGGGKTPPGAGSAPPDSLKEDFALCSPPTLGSPGRGGRRARPLGAHVQSTAPRCRKDTRPHGHPRGASPALSGEPGRGWGQEWSGGASPLWPTPPPEERSEFKEAEERPRSSGAEEDAHGRGAECSERGPTDITAPGSFPFQAAPVPPGLPQGAPGCPRVLQGACILLARAQEWGPVSLASPRVPQSRESTYGPCPGAESRGEEDVGSRCGHGRQNADVPPHLLPMIREHWEAKSCWDARCCPTAFPCVAIHGSGRDTTANVRCLLWGAGGERQCDMRRK